ncbi:MAG: hypothetical protein KAX57_03905 [Rhodoferax sp.]|jgi:hypothetical protein|uniref:hypothetical protein n=1 Tax=Rhodoferax sp. TaxID=50421 RepID=UPI001B7A847A|nr:hypothetical protein [Rhodoferax sp.]MBP8285964.1 hypothetical protein [Rhodoferax sp.]MBP9149991.1 hypothetical protein [Rhodoferax sp.]MBP9735584.1 hypothetical protein [Rhodoferax sp.]
MKGQIAKLSIAVSVILTSASTSFDVKAHSETAALSAVSALPVASVMVASAAGTVVALPVVLSTAGAVLVVKAVTVTAKGSLYLLERASDGTQVSVEVLARGFAATSVAAGTLATVSVIGTGMLLSSAGQVIAFIPNELGRALLYNEQVTR